MNSNHTCRVCGAAGPFSKHSVSEMNFGSKERFLYLECFKCGSLQIATVPSDLSRHYPSDYLGSRDPPESTRAFTLRKAIRHFVRRARTAYLIRAWNPIGWAAYQRYQDMFAPHL